jgi:alkylation response protein AidB-like acyl-CoA dehydrogenase
MGIIYYYKERYPLASKEFEAFLSKMPQSDLAFDANYNWAACEYQQGHFDRTYQIPKEVMEGLGKLGAFAIKIPTTYGGVGFTQVNYNRVMHMISSYCGSTAVLLSAHQSIGVPQPLILFGTEEQKKKFLPRVAKGEISAFALTENGVGSDPATMTTRAEPTADGKYFTINGEKLWCTNGTLAELLVVMARNPKTKKISAFIVETAWEGVTVQHRCRFMGLKALANAVITFENVKVPKKNLIGKVGEGFKIALKTLDHTRPSISAGAVGAARAAMNHSIKYAKERKQFNQPIASFQALRHRVADMKMQQELARSMSYYASLKLGAPLDERRRAMARAKYQLGVSMRFVGQQCIQLHGAMGMSATRC